MKKLLSWFGVNRSNTQENAEAVGQASSNPDALADLYRADHTKNDLILRRTGITLIIVGLSGISYGWINALFFYGVYSLGWVLLAIWGLKREWLGLSVLLSFFATFTLFNEVSAFIEMASGG